MKISRRALYEAVWSKPVRTLAREWGISDVGLAKACRKHDIPLPPVGYWAKEAVGRAPEKPGLGGNLDIEVAFDGAPSFKKQPLSDGTKQQLEAALQATAALVDKNSAPPLARWTKKTQLALCRKPDANGFVTAGKDAFRVSVSKGLVERAVQILNTIETALSAAGMDWTVVEGQGSVVGKLLGVAVSFRLDEQYRRTEHVEKHPTSRWLDRRTYSYQFLGDLTIRIDGSYEGRKSWSDGKTRKLEEILPEVVEGFIFAAEAMRRRRLEQEEQQRRWAEEARLRAERERIAYEQRVFSDAAVKEARAWADATLLRQYVAHLRDIVNSKKLQLTDTGLEWLVRAEKAADRLDPSRRWTEG